MDINQLRRTVNSLSPEELQDFSAEAVLRYGVNKLLDKPIQEHLLTAAEYLINERMMLLGLRPRTKHLPRPQMVVHTIDRRQRQRGRNGPIVIVRKGSLT